MTEEQKAEEKYCKNCKLRLEQCLWAWRNTNGLDMPNNQNCSCKEVPAYIAGAKENGIQWHDLRKDPNDLPKIKEGKNPKGEPYHISDVVQNQKGQPCLYDYRENKWWSVGSIFDDVIAWCERPQFKE